MKSGIIQRLLTTTVVVSSALAALGAQSALAGGIGCGATVTASIVLQSDITGCKGDGLLVGAPNITIDLNGHTLSGAGTSGFGIFNKGYGSVTVKNGAIVGFHRAGVEIHGPKNTVTGMKLNDNESGIALVGSSYTEVSKSLLVGGGGLASLRVLGGTENLITGNTVTNHAQAAGIEIANGADRTIVSGNSVDGALQGIAVADTATSTTLSYNTASHSIYDGLYAAGSTRVSTNAATSNGRLGIRGTPATADGGGNTASGNNAGGSSSSGYDSSGTNADGTNSGGFSAGSYSAGATTSTGPLQCTYVQCSS